MKAKILFLLITAAFILFGCEKENNQYNVPNSTEETNELIGTYWSGKIWYSPIGSSNLYAHIKFETNNKVNVTTNLNGHNPTSTNGSYNKVGNQISFSGLHFYANSMDFTFSSATLLGEKLSVTGTRKGKAMTWNFSM